MTEPSMRDRILDAAERRARESGYHGFSFRDVAADVGVKSASVHYHFPTKAALGEALAERYGTRALEALGAPETPLEAFDRVAAQFRAAQTDDRRMCLCGMFGAERDGLPEEVVAATERYFKRMIEVIDRAALSAHGAPSGETLMATLEGALIVSRAVDDPETFERVVAELRRAYAASA